MSLNKEAIKEWVKALRSGEYVQGRSCLRSIDNKFCCLGVVCEIAVKKGIIPPPVVSSGPMIRVDGDCRTEHYYYSGDAWASLPDEVREWLGFKCSNPSLAPSAKGKNWSLAFLNDQKGLSFNEIADILDQKDLHEI